MKDLEAKTGVLLINLGTPDAQTPKAVAKYLKQFLMDPYVIDIHPIARWFLVNLAIVPFRSRRSARAYQKIWTEEGSPLKVHSLRLAGLLGEKMGEFFIVRMGMRYGNPSIEQALCELMESNVSSIKVLPLYPQYATSSTESALQEVYRVKESIPSCPPIQVLGPFYDNPDFIAAVANQGALILSKINPDLVIFSFHGLPERQIKKLAPEHCYRAHCFQTAKGIALQLGLSVEQYQVTFQSRLGRTPWIKPFTDHVLELLPGKGFKRLVIFCPSFVADCLETLEEIEIRGRAIFLKAGGECFEMVPSLNEGEAWISALLKMLTHEE